MLLKSKGKQIGKHPRLLRKCYAADENKGGFYSLIIFLTTILPSGLTIFRK